MRSCADHYTEIFTKKTGQNREKIKNGECFPATADRSETDIAVGRYSSALSPQRTPACVFRFIRRLKQEDKGMSPLAAEEIQDAEIFILRSV